MSRRNNYTLEFHDPKTKKISQILRCVLDCPNPSYCVQGCACQLPKYAAMVKEFQELSAMVISKDDITNCKVPHIIPVTVSDSNLKAIYLNLINIQPHGPLECQENKTYSPRRCTQWMKRRELAFSQGHCEHSWVERRKVGLLSDWRE